jgi:hypothetical protein
VGRVSRPVEAACGQRVCDRTQGRNPSYGKTTGRETRAMRETRAVGRVSRPVEAACGQRVCDRTQGRNPSYGKRRAGRPMLRERAGRRVRRETDGATPNQGSNSLGSSSLKRAACWRPATADMPGTGRAYGQLAPLNRLDFRENAKIFAFATTMRQSVTCISCDGASGTSFDILGDGGQPECPVAIRQNYPYPGRARPRLIY